jgi:general stress protein YciG
MASKQTGSSHQPEGSERGGSGNFANDPEKATDAGTQGRPFVSRATGGLNVQRRLVAANTLRGQ